MISIIIPVYNCEKYIERCINSLIEQSDEIELIIVNDGSKDNTENILKKYNDINNIKIINQKNMGVSYARNRGVEEATGDYIMFCDADDMYDDRVIDTIENRIKENRSDLIVFGRKDIENDKIICIYPILDNIERNINNIEYLEKYFCNGKHTFSVVNKVYRKNILQENNIRFNTNIKLSEDTLFNLEYILLCNSFEILENVYYLRYYNKESTIGKINNNFYNENTKIIDIFKMNLSIEEKEKYKKAINVLYKHYAFVSINRICYGADNEGFRKDIIKIKSIISDTKQRKLNFNEGNGIKRKVFNFLLNNNYVTIFYFIYSFMQKKYTSLKKGFEK